MLAIDPLEPDRTAQLMATRIEFVVVYGYRHRQVDASVSVEICLFCVLISRMIRRYTSSLMATEQGYSSARRVHGTAC